MTRSSLPQVMRAARVTAYGGPEVLRVDEVPTPSPGPRDVLVEVHASSVNPTDVKARMGSQRGAVRWQFPWITGLDVSGVVVARGEEVRAFEVGDEVFSSPTHKRPGCWAEYVAIDEGEVARKPANTTHVEAATLPLVGLTAYDCLVPRLSRGPNQKVFIEAGAGGVGSFAIQLARVFDAEVATSCSARNEAFVRELGATVVVDYTKQRFDEVVRDCDLVLESAGRRSASAALRAARRGGEVASINPDLWAFVSRFGPRLGLLAAAGHVISYTVRGAVKGRRVRSLVRTADGAHLARIAGWVEEGRIKPIVDRAFPLAEIAAASEALAAGGLRGKVAIQVR